MSQEHIGYPYDFEKIDPIEAYWATHGRQLTFWAEPEKPSAWADGRVALWSLVVGLVVMLVVSLLLTGPALAHKKKKKGHAFNPVVTAPEPPKKACLTPVRVVGSQWATEGGAEESAQKAWAEETRFSYGEAYMDLANAVGYQKRCARSSIGEVAGQTLMRCEVDAVPCRPPFSAGASK
ncbi:hypothetical protein [Sphingorhabdus sp.]|uniref:hypothetical protein n=1 Tax=Sphingorhabdus sp. TaxID=1902408 RepID=UPI002FDEFAEF